MNARRLLIAALLLLVTGHGTAVSAATPELDGWVNYLDAMLPRAANIYRPHMVAPVAQTCENVDEWATYAAAQFNTVPRALDVIRQLLASKARVDSMLDRALEQRTQFAELDASIQRDAVRSYQRIDARLIDLSGRLRYLLSDALHNIAADVTDPAERRQFLDLLAEYHSSIGATAMANWLVDERQVPEAPPQPQPPQLPRLLGRRFGRRQEPQAAEPPPALGDLAFKVLQLIAASGEASLLPRVAEYLHRPDTPADRVLYAAETIRALGLPQDVRPGTPDNVVKPAITAGELYNRLLNIDRSSLGPDWGARYSALLAWLDARRRSGLAEDSFQIGSFQVQAGDWLLMRNPSPYNLFTDLSPGLFTHVGIVTTEQGADGIRRMVIVDLQEHGHMSAINVEMFVQRSLHYVFMRHPDPAVARQMADAARSVIGNETEFDLNFRTERVLALAHKPLAGKKIRTYCAGLLLLCAVQTSADWHEFFPIIEYAAGGLTAENLTHLGMKFGKDFVSPTSALYSNKLVLVGRREPMYEPRRQIEEAVYDYFAAGLADKKLVPDPELFNSLRYKVAETARHSPLLAQALASASGINADADLVGAARAAAVLEMLDQVAQRSSAAFEHARNAVRTPASELPNVSPADLGTYEQLRRRHADLVKQWESEELSPRNLRIQLVDYYIREGCREIDRQFFNSAGESRQPATAGQSGAQQGQ